MQTVVIYLFICDPKLPLLTKRQKAHNTHILHARTHTHRKHAHTRKFIVYLFIFNPEYHESSITRFIRHGIFPMKITRKNTQTNLNHIVSCNLPSSMWS